MDLDLLNVSEDLKRRNPQVFQGIERKPSKYKNVRTILMGRTFASGREAVRAGELALLLKAGEIFCLNFQVRFPLAGKTHYVADFVYLDKKLQVRAEDSKGFKTKEYLLKKRLFKERYGIEITEV